MQQLLNTFAHRNANSFQKKEESESEYPDYTQPNEHYGHLVPVRTSKFRRVFCEISDSLQAPDYGAGGLSQDDKYWAEQELLAAYRGEDNHN